MMKSKKIRKICFLVCVLAALSGCSSQKNSNSETSSLDTQSRVKEVQTTEQTSTEASESTTEFVEEILEETIEKNVENRMEFRQIQHGDYSSLIGEWEEVAISLNRKDGKGDTWIAPQGEELSISKNQITTSTVMIQGNVLNDGIERALHFIEDDGHLEGNSIDDAITWGIYFYPEGVEMLNWGDTPQSIDTDKDRIIIRTSNNNYVQVYQKESSEIFNVEEELDKWKEMNFLELKNGDYSSINGIWKNGLGESIVIDNTKMEFTDVLALKDSGPGIGIVEGQKLIIPSWSAADGTPNRVPYISPDNMVDAYNSELRISEFAGVLSLSSNMPGSIISISFLPSGVSGDIQGGDITKEKIISVGTQNNPTAVSEENIYYRVE